MVPTRSHSAALLKRIRQIVLPSAAALAAVIFAWGFILSLSTADVRAEEVVSEEPLNGWVTADDAVYFYIDGAFVTGLQKIDGSLYYFSGEGVMQTGFVSVDGIRRYFRADGTAIPKGWFKRNGVRYYSKGSGRLAVKPAKINGKVFMFRKNGSLKKTKGLFRYNGSEYLGSGTGTLRTGWRIVRRKYACYFNRANGRMIKDRRYRNVSFPGNGRLGKAYVRGIRFLNRHGWSLKKAFFADVRSTKYAYHDMRRKSVESYANFGFTKHRGNCFVFASQFYICAKLLGYDVTQWDGYVTNRNNPHSWCSIRHKDGRVLIYDASFQDGHSNRHPGAPTGFGFTEGTRGTWMYMKDYRTPVKSSS